VLVNNENHYTLEINSRQVVTISIDRNERFGPHLELIGYGVSDRSDSGRPVTRILEPGTYQITVKRTTSVFTPRPNFTLRPEFIQWPIRSIRHQNADKDDRVRRFGLGSIPSGGVGLFRLSASGRDVPKGAGTGAALVLGAEVRANLV